MCKEGNWKALTRNHPYGEDALYARYSGSYTFAPKLVPGGYNVYLWWTSSEFRSRRVPVTIGTVKGDVIVLVNQRINGSQWNLLGTYDLDDSAFVRISVATKLAVCADAVQFEAIPMAVELPLASPPAMTCPPPAPTGLMAVGNVDRIHLDWDDSTSSKVASYSLYRSATSATGYQLLASELKSSDYTDTAIADGMTFVYTVTAVDEAGMESAQSSEASASSADSASQDVSPSLPTGLLALTWYCPTTNADGSQLSDLAGFKVYIGTGPGAYTTVEDVGYVTSYTMNSLPPATYYFVVTAYDTSGNQSTPSIEVSKTIQEEVRD